MGTDFSTITPIDERAAVSAEELEHDIAPRNAPVVLRQQFADWPVVQVAKDSPEALIAYLRDFAPDHPVNAFEAPAEVRGRYFYTDDFRGVNFDRIDLALGDLLARLSELREVDDGPSLYAGAIPLKGPLEPFLEANSNSLVPPEIEQLSSLWIGGQGVTATHYDLPQNVAVCVHGRRRFTVFPPDQLDKLYLGPLDRTLAGQPVSIVSLHEPDLEQFPKFADALAHAQTTVLEPGDAIYLPSMWFHNVESLDWLGVLVNFWWRDAAVHMFTPMFTMLHAMLSIKGMPEYEKQCWKRMFDHYVFEVDGDPMAHIPEEARGFFGELDEEKIVRLRLRLLHSLGGQPRQG